MAKRSNRYLVRQAERSKVSVNSIKQSLERHFNQHFIIEETGRRALTVSFLNDTPQFAIQSAMDQDFEKGAVAVDIYEALKPI